MHPPASAYRNRRELLKSGVAVGSLLAASQGARLSARPRHPTRLKVACIGVGGRGGGNLKSIAATGKVEIVALCDVSQLALHAASKLFPEAKTFRDFRAMYPAIEDDIDAVVVSTTEHTHAYATLPAILRGKHVYCEKPLAYNVFETRRVAEAAAQADVVTQMGTQIHASENYHRVVELIQSGAIGDVHEVHVWVGRAWGLQTQEEAKQNKDRLFVAERPTEKMEPPEHLDWDLWLGPAPWRPYHEVYFPGPNWYRWWDFGNGTMSDLGSHWNDLPFWALRLDAPQSVESFSALPAHPEIAPASMKTVYEYGPRGNLPAVRLTWYQGAEKPEIWKQNDIPRWSSGVLFEGSGGMLLSDYRKHSLLPEKQFKDFVYPESFLPDSPGHHLEFVEACLGSELECGSPFHYAGPLTEANHLGNVAFRVGEKLQWDPEEMRCIGSPAAERFLRRDPREGWKL